MRYSKGYTLVELLVVMGIVGTLTAMAIPSYSKYTRTAKRLDAHITLQNIAVLQERWMSQFNQYTDNVEDLIGSTTSPEKHYKIKIVHQNVLGGSVDCTAMAAPSAVNKRVYTVIAEPDTEDQKKDLDCSCIYLTSLGIKGSNGDRVDSMDCW